MSKERYNRLTNVAIALVVAGALLYDKHLLGYWVSIGLIAAGGLLAGGVYLYNQFLRNTTEETEEVVRSIENTGRIGVSVDRPPALARAGAVSITQVEAKNIVITAIDPGVHIQALMEAERKLALERQIAESQRKMLMMLEARLEIEEKKRANSFMDQFLAHSVFARELRYNFLGKKSLITPEVELSPKEAALCITEIIRHVSNDPGMKGMDYHVDQRGLHLSEGRAHGHRVYEVEMDIMDLMLGRPQSDYEDESAEEGKAWGKSGI